MSLKPNHSTVKTKQAHPADAQYSRRQKNLRRGLIATVVLGLACLGSTLWFLGNHGDSATGRDKLKQVLQVNQTVKNQHVIQSTLGMEFTINPDQVKVKGYVGGEGGKVNQVTGDGLNKADDYSVFEVYAKDEAEQYATPSTLRISTNVNADFFQKRRAELGSKLSDTELMIKFFQPKNNKYASYREVDRNQTKIAGHDYTHVSYEETDTQYLTTKQKFDFWFTIQHNRPYLFSLHDSSNSVEAPALLQSIAASINYFPPGQLPRKQSAAITGVSSKVLAADDATLGDNANVPTQLEEATSLKVAARNQPAVVRIGTIHCADIELLIDGQPHSSYPDTCDAGSGSGSIVSSDGYVSTNGHVTRIGVTRGLVEKLLLQADAGNAAPLTSYLQYLIASGVLSRAELASLAAAANAGDKVAEEKLLTSALAIPAANIRIANDSYQYAVQLSDEPIKLNLPAETKWSFRYSDKVVSASYTDADFIEGSDVEHVKIYQSVSSDVSILKIAAHDLPVVRLGSLARLTPGSLITAMGFPAFVDGGLLTKASRTIPSITQGTVRSVEFDSADKIRKVVQSSVPLAGGNSGGPAFDTNGFQVGLNTYASLGNCPDDKCFSRASYFRDIADYQKLLAKNKITLNTNSAFQTTWDRAIDDFIRGNYTAAAALIETSQRDYPNNYLATNLLDSAKKQLATEQAIQADKDRRRAYLILGGAATLLLFGSAVWLFISLVRHTRAAPPLAVTPGVPPPPPSS